MNELSCIIVDDDELFHTVLRNYVSKTDFLKLEGSYTNAIEASNFLENNPVNIIFLDIEMPEMTGLEMLNVLDYKPEIILISSKEEYALDAFEHNVTDYILKSNTNYSRFLKAVSRARSNLKEDFNPYFFIKEDSRLVKICLEDIDYIEAYGDYVKIHVSQKTHITLSTLKAIIKKLPSSDFVQVHRSYIVRLDKIDEVQGSNIHINEKTIPLSRTQRDDILKRIRAI